MGVSPNKPPSRNDLGAMSREGVKKGNKVFGAAILKRSDLSLVVVGTNTETECPLWHGEVRRDSACGKIASPKMLSLSFTTSWRGQSQAVFFRCSRHGSERIGMAIVVVPPPHY